MKSQILLRSSYATQTYSPNNLDVVSIIVLGIATYLALVFAPTEAVMGQVQRVFYFHIGTAWVGLLGFVIAAIAGITYLVTKDVRWDRFEVAAVEVSTVFFSSPSCLAPFGPVPPGTPGGHGSPPHHCRCHRTHLHRLLHAAPGN